MTIETCRSSKPPIWSKNCATQNVVFEELIFPDEIHDLLRWSDWVRAYRATAEQGVDNQFSLDISAE